MQCIRSSINSLASALHFSTNSQPLQVGTLNALSPSLIAHALSFLPNPLTIPPTCRDLRSLAMDARKIQLSAMGISIEKIERACSRASIDPFCIEILQQYSINLSSISARTENEIRAEFALLLQNRFRLLQNPQKLDDYLFDRLTQESWDLAGTYFCNFHPPQSAGLWQRMRESVSSLFKAHERQKKGNLSRREMATDKVLSVLSSMRPHDQLPANCASFNGELKGEHWWSRGESCEFKGLPYFRIDRLALPAFEVFRRLEKQGFRDRPHFCLILRRVSVMPSGIGSLKEVHELRIEDSACSSVPPSIADLALRSLEIRNCPNLLHFPKSLRNLHTIQWFSLYGNCAVKQLLEEIGKWPVINLRICCTKGIEHLPKSFRKMGTLQHLTIDHCSMTVLKEISQLQLETLTVSTDEPDFRLPLSLEDMNTLKTLTVYANNPKPYDPVAAVLSRAKVLVTFLHH